MHVLERGGAGYIGSHVVLALRESGYHVIVLDNLSTGKRELVPGDVAFVEGDVGDRELTERVIERFDNQRRDSFAGSIVVRETVGNPLEYCRNNTCVSRSLIASCVSKGVRQPRFMGTRLSFRSRRIMPTIPMNPYGASKLMTEWILRDAATAHDLT